MHIFYIELLKKTRNTYQAQTLMIVWYNVEKHSSDYPECSKWRKRLGSEIVDALNIWVLMTDDKVINGELKISKKWTEFQPYALREGWLLAQHRQFSDWIVETDVLSVVKAVNKPQMPSREALIVSMENDGPRVQYCPCDLSLRTDFEFWESIP